MSCITLELSGDLCICILGEILVNGIAGILLVMKIFFDNVI